MARKRKRSSAIRDDQEPPSKRSTDHHARRRSPDASTPRHPVLQQFYPEVRSLRAHVLSTLEDESEKQRCIFDHIDAEFAQFVNSTIVGSGLPSTTPASRQARVQQFISFSQQVSGSTAKSADSVLISSQNEIVDFVVWLLFRQHSSLRRPPHLLCHGFQRAAAVGQAGLQLSANPGILGIQSYYPNQYIEIVKAPHWCRLLSLLGKLGEQFMIDLLLDCGLFEPTGGIDNLTQISGTPLSDLKALPNPNVSGSTANHDSLPNAHHSNTANQQRPANNQVNKPTSIRFVRHRMLYARPTLNGKGNPKLGLSHIHVLNRCKDLHDAKQTQYIMHYVFPRQYGLHNSFTSKMDPKETTHAFKDYTLREKEISSKIRLRGKDAVPVSSSSEGIKCLPFPKRLRGKPFDLIAKLRKLHVRCSYTELLRHYCPFPTSLDLQLGANQPDQVNFLKFATPASHVSAFCRSVLINTIPLRLWGDGDTAFHNRSRVSHHVDRFVKARKYETITLHDVLDGLKIHDISWLAPSAIAPGSKLSLTDFQKRKEIFMEFLYYVFDSFLIPLIRTNFYVTESNVNRNQLFYFRQDVWRSLAEPSLSQLKLAMFDEMKTEKALQALGKRSLPYGQIRLLPKQSGTRPISNLRKRIQRRQNGKLVLGPSVNTIMKPVFNVVKFEKETHHDHVGSSLFSVGDMLPKLREFRNRLKIGGAADNALYFAKVDVRSCFDSIPQRKVINLLERLVSANDYRTARHAEIKALFTGRAKNDDDRHSNISRKFVSNGYNGNDFFDFQEMLNNGLSKSRAKTIFVDSVVQSTETRDYVLDLLSEHIERNIVKVGKKYYRQKNGIPQGSILSSLLCNLFYAQLEKENLSFTGDRDCLLLRMIDDFLLITTRQEKATRFLQIMHDGIPDFGVSVKPEKSLTNFPAEINGFSIATLSSQTSPFPYCGNLIDPTTLNLSKDRERIRSLGPISDTLTVEFSKQPGRSFRRKALNALKLQMHSMFLDSSFNAITTVLSNLYHSYTETAQKCFAYIKGLPAQKRPSSRLLSQTVEDVISLSFVMMSRRERRTGQWEQYECVVSKMSAQWLACTAFSKVFAQKQTKYQVLLAWLARETARARLTAEEIRLLTSVIPR